MGATLTLVGLLANILVGLKNSAGQPLIPGAVAQAVTAGEGIVTAIVADIQAARTSGATSQTATAAYLQTIQVLLAALQSEKVLSAQTVTLISGMSAALAEALKAEQAAQQVTDPSNLATPIPLAV